MRSSIFVDAGYLYAQGSQSLAGHKIARQYLILNIQKAVELLYDEVMNRAGHCDVLRIYWYDGLIDRNLTDEQQRVAGTSNVKIRLGIVNPSGQQKGVDSLIVTDLVELARNRAIGDAFVLSGDEDLRIGVQIAQSFGVRVHLIGIEPSAGSQSRTLAQEADTTLEWTRSQIEDILSVSSEYAVPTSHGTEFREEITPIIQAYANSLSPNDIQAINNATPATSIPQEYDRPLLRSCRDILGRDLDPNTETPLMRRIFREICSSASTV